LLDATRNDRLRGVEERLGKERDAVELRVEGFAAEDFTLRSD